MKRNLIIFFLFMIGLYGGLGIKVRNIQYQLGEHWLSSNTFSNSSATYYALQDRIAGKKVSPHGSLGFSFIVKLF